MHNSNQNSPNFSNVFARSNREISGSTNNSNSFLQPFRIFPHQVNHSLGNIVESLLTNNQIYPILPAPSQIVSRYLPRNLSNNPTQFSQIIHARNIDQNFQLNQYQQNFDHNHNQINLSLSLSQNFQPPSFSITHRFPLPDNQTPPILPPLDPIALRSSQYLPQNLLNTHNQFTQMSYVTAINQHPQQNRYRQDVDLNHHQNSTYLSSHQNSQTTSTARRSYADVISNNNNNHSRTI
jgi:hypothetical protein